MWSSHRKIQWIQRKAKKEVSKAAPRALFFYRFFFKKCNKVIFHRLICLVFVDDNIVRIIILLLSNMHTQTQKVQNKQREKQRIEIMKIAKDEKKNEMGACTRRERIPLTTIKKMNLIQSCRISHCVLTLTTGCMFSSILWIQNEN